MATLDQIGLSLQIVQNAYGLLLNMRDNAAGYQTQAADPKTDLKRLAQVMVADANEYQRRVKWITDLAERNAKVMGDALGALGVTADDVLSLCDTLHTAADTASKASLSDPSQIDAAANAILSAVPDVERIF